MSDRVSFICYSRAAPQGSKRHLGNGVLVESSKRVKPFRTDVQGVAIEATPVDWDLGLEYHLRVDFLFLRPKSHFTSKGALTKAAPLFPTGRQIGDTDKLIRSVCDALTGITWYDDSQVVDITAKKRFASRDQVIVTIKPVIPPIHV
jgi:crossover junction endodeoxyribonuclease RusA